MLVDTECMRIAGGSWSDPRGMAHITFLISTMSLYGRRSDGRWSVLLDWTIFFLMYFCGWIAAVLFTISRLQMRLNCCVFVSFSDAAELLRVWQVFGIPMRELCFNIAFTTREPWVLMTNKISSVVQCAIGAVHWCDQAFCGQFWWARLVVCWQYWWAKLWAT